VIKRVSWIDEWASAHRMLTPIYMK